MSTRAAPMTVRKTISVSCSVDRGWERLGDHAAEAYGSYDSGWGVVLAAYVGKASEA